MQVGSLSSTAKTALNAIDGVFRQVDDIASRVAAGIETEFEESTAQLAGALAELPGLKQHAVANARVVETAETLLSELGSLPRR